MRLACSTKMLSQKCASVQETSTTCGLSATFVSNKNMVWDYNTFAIDITSVVSIGGTLKQPFSAHCFVLLIMLHGTSSWIHSKIISGADFRIMRISSARLDLPNE